MDFCISPKICIPEMVEDKKGLRNRFTIRQGNSSFAHALLSEEFEPLIYWSMLYPLTFALGAALGRSRKRNYREVDYIGRGRVDMLYFWFAS